MLIAKRSASSNVVIDKIVGKEIVVQAASLAWGESLSLRIAGGSFWACILIFGVLLELYDATQNFKLSPDQAVVSLRPFAPIDYNRKPFQKALGIAPIGTNNS